MDGWSILVRGLVCLVGALLFLRILTNSLQDLREQLDAVERRKRVGARQRAEIESIKVEKVA